MEEMSAWYNVVFEYTSEAGSYAGGRFRTAYKSKDDFQKDNSSEALLELQLKVIAEGVSEEDAIQICNRMTDDVLWRTAVEEATLRNAPLVDDKAQLSLQILKMNLLNRGLQLTPGVIKSVLKTYHISETVVKPESLEIGAHFRLTGDACNSEERDNKHIYEVTNQNLDCKLGAHLIVKDETGIEQEMRIMPWVPVIRIG